MTSRITFSATCAGVPTVELWLQARLYALSPLRSLTRGVITRDFAVKRRRGCGSRARRVPARTSPRTSASSTGALRAGRDTDEATTPNACSPSWKGTLTIEGRPVGKTSGPKTPAEVSGSVAPSLITLPTDQVVSDVLSVVYIHLRAGDWANERTT